MSKQMLAIALCRVSSLEQLQNNSLKHQKDNVLKAAENLGATIPKDGIWEGQVSSKQGVNFNRKDLLEMFDYCKKNPKVKYLIVQEVDRFMRSPDEQTYWYVRFFYEVNVKVWYADKPELNEDTHVASLLRFMEGWRAGGSNVERQNKSINGQTAALKEGRYPFAPKPGYMKGSQTAIPEIHPVGGSALKKVLLRIAAHQVTPSQGLVELNQSEFMEGHAPYKMDKFRKILTDPFYAGILEIDKQVKFRNENGLHEPLISKEQHCELIKIMSNKLKNQRGARKNGNPKYPCNNIVTCDSCVKATNGRVVGFDHTNGRNKAVVYERYRCRACGKYMKREELHQEVEGRFKENPVTDGAMEDLTRALDLVWREKEGEAEDLALRISRKIRILNMAISNQVEAATDPSNITIKEDIMASIANKKEAITKLEEKLEKLKDGASADREEFLRFAFQFVQNMGAMFLEISPENRQRCKQVVFPGGFYLDENKKVYTTQISPLITLAVKKKDTEVSKNSRLVRVKRL